MPTIKCPLCSWSPDGGEYWQCLCGTVWNTFSTKGKCPTCSIQWEDTFCISCSKRTPHKDWYFKKNEIKLITVEKTPSLANIRKYIDNNLPRQEGKIKDLIKPIIKFDLPKSSGVKIGKSKVGGKPHLPKGTPWPKFKGKSIWFYGQINFSELDSEHLDIEIPKEGILYLFSHFPDPEDGNDAPDGYPFFREQFEDKAIFSNKCEDLEIRDFPNDLHPYFRDNEYLCKPVKSYMLPPENHESIKALQLNSEEKETYEKIFEKLDPFDDFYMFGYPCPMQNEVELEWVQERYPFEWEDYEKQEERILKDCNKFVHLLSFSVDLEVMYVGIEKTDLEQLNLGKSVFTIQGT